MIDKFASVKARPVPCFQLSSRSINAIIYQIISSCDDIMLSLFVKELKDYENIRLVEYFDIKTLKVDFVVS